MECRERSNALEGRSVNAPKRCCDTITSSSARRSGSRRLCCVCAVESTPLPPSDTVAGLDMDVTRVAADHAGTTTKNLRQCCALIPALGGPAADHAGTTTEATRACARSHARPATARQRVSRRRNGSDGGIRRSETRRRMREQMTRQRNDSLHTVRRRCAPGGTPL